MDENLSHFIITLPSDVKPSNKPYDFTVDLPYNLGFSDEWEVGLWSIFYTKDWQNIVRDFTFTVAAADVPKNFTNSAGYYSSIDQLCRTITNTVNTGFDASFEFLISYHTTQHKVHLSIPPGGSVYFGDNLGQILGFPGDSWILKSDVGSNIFALPNEVKAIFLYADIVTPQVVGKTESPLIEIIPVESGYARTVKYSPVTVSYLPLSRRNISSIRFQLADASGSLVPFRSGPTVVQLRFKKSLRL